jgi:CRP/FNR family transcriptional regulator
MSAIYKPRQVVFHEGTPATGLYFLCHGVVKLYQSGRFGREHILAIDGPGDVLGELPVVASDTYSASAEALVESQLCYVSRDKLESLIQAYPMTGMRLLAGLSAALIAARRKVRDMVLKPAEVRLAELLARLAAAGTSESDGTTHVTLPYSRRDIAEMVGISTETAIRLLAKLKQKGVLATNGREVVIADMAKLTRMTNPSSYS